jgi:methyl-accepting chemotaxis protein
LVVLFVLVSLLIGSAGVVAIKLQSEALRHSTESAEHYALMQNLAFDIEEVAANLRAMMLTTDAARKEQIRQQIEDLSRFKINPVLNEYVPLPEEEGKWADLIDGWSLYSTNMDTAIGESIENSGYKTRTLSIGPSYTYWMSYEPVLYRIIELAQEKDHYLNKDIMIQAYRCLEASKSLQLHEKMAILATDDKDRQAFIRKGAEDLRSYSASLNILEKLMLNPMISDEEYEVFNAGFAEATKGKVKINDDGTATWTKTAFQLPDNFVVPSNRVLSQYYWDNVKPLRGGGTQIFDRITSMTAHDSNQEAIRITTEVCFPVLEKITEDIAFLIQNGQNRLNEVKDEAVTTTSHALKILYVVIILGLGVGITLASIFTSKLNSSLKRVSHELGDISAQIETATGQLATASDALAQGASEHAVAVHETRSSLEDLSNKIKNNNTTAKAADEVMTETTKEVREAEDSMQAASAAMNEIAQSGGKIEKILKTINGIAFQTNLLALNAAVEASRAGEAGAGFAIVAEEVRNLAIRSAEAAKDSGDLIFQMIRNIESGTAFVTATANRLSETSERIARTSSLFTEMSNSSEEQSQNIDTIHETIVQMDAVIQANSAAAEETAGAAEGLSQQVHVLRIDMNHLLEVTDGIKSSYEGELILPPPPGDNYDEMA